MATQKIPEYEQRRNENVRRNNELLASLHIPPIGPQPIAPSKRQRCSSIPRMVEANRDTTVMTRKGRGKLMAAATLAPDSSTSTQHADIPCNEAADDVEEGEEEEEGSDTQQTKRTGRGPAKGSKGYGTKGVIFRKRIISTDAARSIWPLFRSELTGPYTTFKKCPQHYLDKLFKLFKNKNFKFDCNEGEVKHAFEAYIENNYKNWMSAIRNSVFRIHKTAAARYANNPSYVPPHIWTLMVDDWLKPTWQEMSDQNKLNRDKLNLVHTTGSVPMAKYIYAEIERTGVEPSPIEMFRRFHVTAGKDGEEERWRSKKAKELYDEMELKKRIEEVLGGEGEEELDEWDIYKEVVSGSKKRHIRGLGDGMEPPEEFYNSSGNQTCLEREEEFRAMKEEVGSLRADVAENKKLLQALMDMVTLGLGASSSSPPNDTIISPTHGDSEEDCAP